MNPLEYYEANVKKYFNKGILIDAGVLLLLAVGMYDEKQIGQLSGTESHDIDDYNLLKIIIRDFKKIVTTPNILTEVCNLISKFPNRTKASVLTLGLASYIEKAEENYIESLTLSYTDCFKNYGLADASIFYSAKGKYFVLTEDGPLWGFLRKNKISVVNFNHVIYPVQE